MPVYIEVLDFSDELERERGKFGFDAVGSPASGNFDDDVLNVFHDIDVVACTAHEGVEADTTVKLIVTGAADEQVVAIAAIKRVIVVVTEQQIVAGVPRELVFAGRADENSWLQVELRPYAVVESRVLRA